MREVGLSNRDLFLGTLALNDLNDESVICLLQFQGSLLDAHI